MSTVEFIRHWVDRELDLPVVSQFPGGKRDQIAQLATILGPTDPPLTRDWSVGFSVPADYCRLVEAYGRHPVQGLFLHEPEELGPMHREFVEFAEEDGHQLWGTTESRDLLWWATRVGDSDSWTVVVSDEAFQGTATDLLLAALTGRPGQGLIAASPSSPLDVRRRRNNQTAVVRRR